MLMNKIGCHLCSFTATFNIGGDRTTFFTAIVAKKGVLSSFRTCFSYSRPKERKYPEMILFYPRDTIGLIMVTDGEQTT